MNRYFYLSNIKGIGPMHADEILSEFPTIEDLKNAGELDLYRCQSFTSNEIADIKKALADDSYIYRKWDKLYKTDIRYIGKDEDEFPDSLRYIAIPPMGIYVRGNLPRADSVKVAMVGARMCTAYGMSVARSMAKSITEAGGEIISGMARGIDAYSHEGAIEAGGRTFAVLAGGVDVIYPKENEKIYRNLLELGGGIISEYYMGEEPIRQMFPQRNRIISALSDAVIIIEARDKSGSLLTANYAMDQGKDLYALPGRITDELSRGTDELIREGAFCISSIEKLLFDLGLKGYEHNIVTKDNKIVLEKEESLLYSCLRLTPKGLDELSRESGLSLTKVINVLASLRSKGYVSEYFMNRYIRRI